MQFQRLYPSLLRFLSAFALFAVAGACGAQAPAPVQAVVPWQTVGAPAGKGALSGLLPELVNLDTVPMVLAKFTPPVTEAQIVNSDYLLLDAPPIALAGPVTVHLMSEIPGTDLFLLFNAKPRANEPSLLSASAVPPLTRAETRISVRLAATTELLLISRANGVWYKVISEVKIAEKDRK
ncbi:MAG: hypothetical protein U0997_14880 [Sulfurimicrobium sp.]|nr:hypothetical protein [Sulfurimicrobium sp.]